MCAQIFESLPFFDLLVLCSHELCARPAAGKDGSTARRAVCCKLAGHASTGGSALHACLPPCTARGGRAAGGYMRSRAARIVQARAEGPDYGATAIDDETARPDPHPHTTRHTHGRPVQLNVRYRYAMAHGDARGQAS